MKLMANIEVFNTLLTGMVKRRKPQRSCLAIGRQSAKSDELYFLLQTQSNKSGTKYKINDNIENVFTKFVNEGKATIKLKEPPLEINIQCDPIQLKSFLHVLKLGLSKKLDPKILTLSNLNPKMLSVAPKTKIVIKQASDYPVLQGFPRSTQELHLSNLQRKSFDRQILKLQNLKILNLSENQLTNLPRELGFLPNLQELNVSNNRLGKTSIDKWAWLSGSNITKNLRLLNLSSNELTGIPNEIHKLHSLVSLYLNNNSIYKIPQGIGNLTNLRFLAASKNNLEFLPGSMRNLRLNELDISGNRFQSLNNAVITCEIRVPSLIESAAQIVLLKRIYYDASIIPFTLVKYLDKANFCMCGSPCFDNLRRFMKMNLSDIAQSIKFSETASDIFFDCYACSMNCLSR